MTEFAEIACAYLRKLIKPPLQSLCDHIEKCQLFDWALENV